MPDLISGPLPSWRRVVVAVSLALLCGLTACDDDATRPSTTSVRIELTVVDSYGNPLPNVNVGLFNDISIPLWWEMDLPAKLSGGTQLGLTVAQAVWAEMTIVDVDGTMVKQVYAGELAAGPHLFSWAGDGETETTLLRFGHYRARVICLDPATQDTLYAAERGTSMLPANPYAFSLGATDEQGQLSITDASLFPCFRGLPDQECYTPFGEYLGDFDWIAAVRIALRDQLTGARDVYRVAIDRGANRVHLVLNRETPKSAPLRIAPAPPAKPTAAADVPEDFELLGPYPNPFYP